MISNESGPQESAFVSSMKGVICDRTDFTLLLEYWSDGVLENRRLKRHLLRMKMRIKGILFAWTSSLLDHYSLTPLLQYSIISKNNHLFLAWPLKARALIIEYGVHYL